MVCRMIHRRSRHHFYEGDEVVLDGISMKYFLHQVILLQVFVYILKVWRVIGGDVLFYESIGRTDLPGGDHQTLFKSIREELFFYQEKRSYIPAMATYDSGV